MDLHLKDKVTLITGASRGIGLATARRFASEGCSLGICARTQEGLDAAVAELESTGICVAGIVADVSREGETERFVREASSLLGGLDVLVCNVGGRVGEGLEESSDEDWVETFNLNVFHAVRAARAAVPLFRSRGGGSIVFISSISGWKPAPGRAQYGAAKAAEMFLPGALAWELAEVGVRANTVCPGSTFFEGGGWDRFRQSFPEQFADFETREFPAKRLGRPEEIADVVVFLASDRASWINGAAIPVDGGQGRPNPF